MTKLRQFSRKEPCYYCGAPPPSTREHVPPRRLFGNHNITSITVPSCDKHNYEKHGHDQGFITALHLCLREMINHGLTAPPTSPQTLEILAKLQDSQLGQVGEFRQFLQDSPAELDFDLPYIRSTQSMTDWIRHITAGLVWAKLGKYHPAIQWDSSYVRSPNFVEASSSVSKDKAFEFASQWQMLRPKIEALPWRSGWLASPAGYPPEIYQYSHALLETSEDSTISEMAFRHQFLGNLTWFHLIEVPSNIVNELIA